MVVQLSINADCPDAYRNFVTQLRESATEELVEHTEVGVGILPEKAERIPNILIATDEDLFTLHIRNSDMYFLGYKILDKWVSFGKECRELNGERATYFTAFDEGYVDMGLSQENDLTTLKLGHGKISDAMKELKRFVVNKGRSNLTIRKKSCATLALMICEATRFDNVSKEVQTIYAEGGLITTDAARFIKCWEKEQVDYDNNDKTYCGPLRLIQKKHKKPAPVVKPTKPTQSISNKIKSIVGFVRR